LNELQQLINDCAANDRLSQEKLYRKFFPALIVMCKRFFADNHQAMEVVNDGMLKVFKRISEYDSSKGDFFNWAYTIVRNTALDKLKLTRIPAALPVDAIDNLPPATRAIGSFFYLEGLSIAEISQHLAISPGTVKWHLNETRNRLKPVFKKHFQ
jgi:RNA polymerase sigma-70 factor (ECF subfamily)